MIIKQILGSIIVIIIISGCAPKIKKEIIEAGPIVRINLGTIDAQDTISFKNNFHLLSEEARYEFGQRNQILFVVPLPNGIQLYNENRNLLYQNQFPIIIKPEDENSHFLFRGKEYSGSLIFAAASDTSLYLVNKLPLEEYLRGVVPAEIPATKPDCFEAIKAQAICARTYAVAKLEYGQNRSFDLYGSSTDQVYAGYNVHTTLSDQAIIETKGIIITYNAKPAQVYYHSTCGGRLESAENVWPEKNFAYLQGGSDAVGDFFSCASSPYFRWSEKRNIAQLDSAFFSQFNKGMLQKPIADTLNLKYAVNITKRNSSGRAAEIEISYVDTTITLSGYNIRRFFAKSPAQYLRSNLIFISQADDSTLTLHGAGYGHGVGMCQFGALYMSQQGFRYYHILGKYFPGTKLSKVYR